MEDSSPLVGTAHPWSGIAPEPLRDPLPLQLHVPTAPHRPGASTCFSPFEQQPGDLPRPDTLASAAELRDHATGLIRVLGDDGAAAGPWKPQLSPHQLRNGLEMMLRAAHFDVRMIAMQRQGRLSFFVSTRGEEAISVAGAIAFSQHDMLFPSYRQSGLLLARGMPLLTMMGQALGNRLDNAKGRQMPVHYSWRAGNVVSISSPVGTQYPQAVGAAMAFAYRNERRVAAAWIGDGTTAQGDFHYALNFASVFRPPSVLHVVDNQWAISTHRNLSTGGTTYAARADAYGLPGIRVDGNDFLAVYAADAWAVERARRGGGTTLIELVTYRREAHSTSDDHSQYRPADEGDHWPGGDPIERLRQHLIRLGQWSDDAHQQLNRALEQEIAATFRQAEAIDSSTANAGQSSDAMFSDVYAEMPKHLRQQLDEMNSTNVAPTSPKTTIFPFENTPRRAAG